MRSSLRKIGNDFDSRRIVGYGQAEDDSGFSMIHVVKSASQILPFCVIRLEEQAAAPHTKSIVGSAASTQLTPKVEPLQHPVATVSGPSTSSHSVPFNAKSLAALKYPWGSPATTTATSPASSAASNPRPSTSASSGASSSLTCSGSSTFIPPASPPSTFSPSAPLSRFDSDLRIQNLN